jgi:hypothetical protein
LRIYRKTKIARSHDELKVDTDYDNIGFYSPIFHFHVWLGAFLAAAMNVGALASRWKSLNAVLVTLFIVNVVSILAYVAAAFKFPLKEIHSGIERDRLCWIQALEKAPGRHQKENAQ